MRTTKHTGALIFWLRRPERARVDTTAAATRPAQVVALAPLAVVASLIALVVIISAVCGHKHKRHDGPQEWGPAPTLSTPRP